MAEEYALTAIIPNQKDLKPALTFIENFIEHTLKLSLKKVVLEDGRVYDYIIRPSDPELAKQSINSMEKPFKFDLIFQKQTSRKNKKLFIFDMDSTLIYQEVIELIAEYANIEDKVAEITERAMNGELDFNESLKERVLLLKGINSTFIWDELKTKIEITNGARELCKALSKLNVVMGVCSGGFIPLAEYIKNKLGLMYAYANTLGTDSDKILDGTTLGYIVNGDKKAELLLQIAKTHNIDPKDAVAVGDGANDLKMMSVAGFGIAWNAKPKVQALAPCCLNTDSLKDILYIMGYNFREIEQLII